MQVFRVGLLKPLFSIDIAVSVFENSKISCYGFFGYRAYSRFCGKKCSPSVFKAVRVKMRKVLNDLKIKVCLVIASKQLS